jgi:hypothetical protein
MDEYSGDYSAITTVFGQDQDCDHDALHLDRSHWS